MVASAGYHMIGMTRMFMFIWLIVLQVGWMDYVVDESRRWIFLGRGLDMGWNLVGMYGDGGGGWIGFGLVVVRMGR